MALTLTYPPGAALISGGTGSVGEGATRRLAQAGLPVVFTYRGNADRAAAIEQELRADGHEVRSTRMDLADPASIDAAIALAIELGGRLHTIVSAAGPMVPFARIADIPVDVLERYLVEDAMGVFRLFSKGVAVLRASGGGSLTACTTIANFRVVDFDGASPFSKGAVEALVRQIAAEEAGSGIRCNAVPVSWVSPLDAAEQIKDMADVPEPTRSYIVALIGQLETQTRFRRPTNILEAGDLFAYLASDQASYVTGQSVRLDGGFSL